MRNHGVAPDIEKTMAAVPTAAITNSVIVGIRNGVVGGGPTVSATRDVQRAIARSSSRDWRSSHHLAPASWG